eukprot:1155891-Pelagomonas_calceolata.AAC.3
MEVWAPTRTCFCLPWIEPHPVLSGLNNTGCGHVVAGCPRLSSPHFQGTMPTSNLKVWKQ